MWAYVSYVLIEFRSGHFYIIRIQIYIDILNFVGLYICGVNWKEEFINKLNALDPTDEEIAAILQFKNLHLPKSLFKYRLPNQLALDSLSTDTVWLNIPTGFNDIAEFNETLDFVELFKTGDLLIKQQRRLLREGKNVIPKKDILRAVWSARLMRLIRWTLPGSFLSKVDRAILATTKSIGEKIQSDIVREKQGHMKVCSFCEYPDNDQMWDEYADFHKGFCIEYDLSRLPMSDTRRQQLFPIFYTDEVYDSTRHHMHQIQNGRSNFLYPMVSGSRKRKQYEFENEWRLIIPIYHSPPENYPMHCQSRVYLGREIADDFKRKVIAICKQQRLVVFQEILPEQADKLIFQQITSL
jgi:hypothetical protein